MERESGKASSAPSKKPIKFVPKIPPRKLTKQAVTKMEQSESKDEIVDKELLSKLNNVKSQEGFGRRVTKVDRKAAPAEVAFGHGNSSLARKFGIPKATVSAIKNQDGSDALAPKLEKEYVEPWDYVHSYYPVRLPQRRPYTGDPEILNTEEFGEALANSTVNEAQINPAEELGFTEITEEPQMTFFQFPSSHPLEDKSDAAVDKKPGVGKVENAPRKGFNLKDMPAGFIGKMLVYKSGKIKLKLGDALFDVTPGEHCVCAQDVVAVNVEEKHCCNLGDLRKHAMVIPDMDALLDSIGGMNL